MKRPRRWLVLGPGGAGKTTLSSRMGRVLELPVVHLDYHFWNPGWVPTPGDAFRAKVADLCDADEWIMDGNYSSTIETRLHRADAVVLLDFPARTCLTRVVRRRFRPHRDGRPEMPEGCPDKLDLPFLWWIATYRRRSRSKVLRSVERHPSVPLWTLRSKGDVERFVVELDSTRNPNLTSAGRPARSPPLWESI